MLVADADGTLDGQLEVTTAWFEVNGIELKLLFLASAVPETTLSRSLPSLLKGDREDFSTMDDPLSTAIGLPLKEKLVELLAPELKASWPLNDSISPIPKEESAAGPLEFPGFSVPLQRALSQYF